MNRRGGAAVHFSVPVIMFYLHDNWGSFPLPLLPPHWWQSLPGEPGRRLGDSSVLQVQGRLGLPGGKAVLPGVGTSGLAVELGSPPGWYQDREGVEIPGSRGPWL